jgi:uncharacterized protein YlzI (FlbEa/FlbD family)
MNVGRYMLLDGRAIVVVVTKKIEEYNQKIEEYNQKIIGMTDVNLLIHDLLSII